jgi:protein SCO1/2
MLKKAVYLLALALIAVATPAGADSPPTFDTASLDSGPNTPNSRLKVLDQVGIDQHLDVQLPLDTPFVDDTGKAIKLGDEFRTRPVLLQFIQFSCQNLCTLECNGLCRAMNGCTLSPGRDYDVLTISFDPRETTELAALKRHNYLSQVNKDGIGDAWHFLTGTQEAIQKVTQAAGFRFVYDPDHDQFIHSGALMICTPDGHLSKYLYGAEYAPNDLRLAVADASVSKIGSLSDSFLLYCFHYDPDTGKYTLAVRNILRAGAALTLGAVGLFVGINLRRERLAAPLPDGGSPRSGRTA